MLSIDELGIEGVGHGKDSKSWKDTNEIADIQKLKSSRETVIGLI